MPSDFSQHFRQTQYAPADNPALDFESSVIRNSRHVDPECSEPHAEQVKSQTLLILTLVFSLAISVGYYGKLIVLRPIIVDAEITDVTLYAGCLPDVEVYLVARRPA